MNSENKKDFKLAGLGKLRDKLLNLNPLYNRKIRFYISERLAWDLTELLNKNELKLVHDFSTSVLNLINNPLETKKNFTFNLEPFFHPQNPEDISQFQKKIVHLRRKNLAIRQEKGQNSLFLGAIFLRGYFYNSSKTLRLVNAPLFLLSCDLEKIKSLDLVFLSESKINYNLLYYLQKELGLAKEKLADFLNKLENNKKTADWKNYLSFLVQELQNWTSASWVKIKSFPVISPLAEKKSDFLIEDEEEIRKTTISPFVEFSSTSSNDNDLIGRVVSTESKEVLQKGDYFGNVIHKIKVEWEKKSSDYLKNPGVIFVYPNLVNEKIITSINQRQCINKKYLFFCEKDSKRWLLRDWREIRDNLNYFSSLSEPKNHYFQPEPFVKLTISNKPKNYPENQLEVVLNFCLTIDSEPNLSLFRDFEEIIEEYSQDRTINWSKSALALLKGEVENVVAYPLDKENQRPETSLYVPFESDPSQTRILKVIFHDFAENTICIDGPPGTGKSQLICNLLANSLAYQKKVLVVCEKEVALKVIADKLSSIGLGPSLIRISELSQTSRIYQEILNHLENSQQTRTNYHPRLNNEKQIASLEEKQKSNLEKIANYCRVEDSFRSRRQVPLHEIYLKFGGEQQPSLTLAQLNKEIKNKEQLDKLKNDLKSYLEKFDKILVKWKPICLQLKSIFLENNLLPFEFNWENKNNFQKIISNLLGELKSEKGEVNLLSQILRIKLALEYSKNHQSTKLLENKIKEVEELQTKPNCQNFFTFLQIENFTDFWQKCSDKEYLLTIQQFISEEFLTIGELHFSLVNCEENTKKNINYFLQKVLVEQEFNYLENYIEVCEQTVYFNWIKEVEEENREVLAYWNQSELARIQHEQQEINQRKKSLVKELLKDKQKLNLDRLSTNQLLMKELNKKRRISSLKKLFPELVNYFPIWITIPEVVASITNRQEVSFDFLIFDEASQVLLEKSIPLWARAKKCIVIGDEQQLPPTDFFKSHLENEEGIWEKEEKIEKLLNELGKDINLEIDDLEKNSNLLTYAKKYARNREKLTLLYHYRSKYPELIEFSNQAFYNSILQIVSASELRKKDYSPPIEYHYQPEGRWINAENEIEARYIVNLLKTFPSNKEIGIITFNVKQQGKIEDYIEEKSQYKNLFVKNLEEVQGDERDIIIFSIGYARNEEGKFYLHFGPLSQEGGEKRLNVAISRAREKVIIVTSLLPSDLSRITDEDENRNLGPKLFKKYLEYAYYCWEKQSKKVQEILKKLPAVANSSLYEKDSGPEEFDSLFEEQVYNELAKNIENCEVHKQVKSIGYHIDLAIWNNRIQQYILGIECDGYYWHSQLKDIERDIYRQQLLENKGWKIIRVLSRDWCRNKEKEIERIKKEISRVF